MQTRYFTIALLLALAACGSEKASPAGAPGGKDASAPRDVAGAASGGSAGNASGGGGGSGGGGAGGGAGSPAADAGAGSAGNDAASAADAAMTSSWPAVSDYAARGPFPITRDSNTGPGGGYDIFRPTQLGPAAQRKHPVISWANGTLFDIPAYQKLLEHWASHGFVVIAGQTNNTAGGATHKAGIDWLHAENARAGSPYLGMIDGSKIGAAGHSQGGGATIAAGSNKPGPTGIVATLPLMPLLRFESDQGIVMRQVAPMLNINASTDDRDPTGAVPEQIFAGAQRELVQASFVGVHEDAMNAAMLRPTLAWFRLHLMGDQAARALFYPGTTCGLCQEPVAWKQVRHKNLP